MVEGAKKNPALRDCAFHRQRRSITGSSMPPFQAFVATSQITVTRLMTHLPRKARMGGSMQDFRGKVAVVTGAASGIGRALADAVSREGMYGGAGRHRGRGARHAARAVGARGRAGPGGPHRRVPGGRGERLAHRALDAFGAVHVVCNNAGVAISGPGVDAYARRLAVGVGRQPLGRDSRRARVHADPAGAGRPGAHRQHRLDGGPDVRAEHGDLQRLEARRRGVVGNALITTWPHTAQR